MKNKKYIWLSKYRYILGLFAGFSLQCISCSVGAATTEAFFFSHDQQGSITSISDAKNQLVLQQGWSPWGARRDNNSQSALSRFAQGHPVRLGYTGHKYLLDSDLVLVGDTRLYDPTLKRFYNTDDRVTGGVRGMNRFAYAYNNALRYIDPDGHAPINWSALNSQEAVEGLFKHFFDLPEALMPDRRLEGVANRPSLPVERFSASSRSQRGSSSDSSDDQTLSDAASIASSVTPENVRRRFKRYINPNGDGIEAAVFNDGSFSFIVKAGPNTPRGGEMFNEAWDAIGHDVTSIRANWVKGGDFSKNYDDYIRARATHPNLTRADVILHHTFTGVMAKRKGFTRVQVVDEVDGFYIAPKFSKPSALQLRRFK